MTDYSPTVAHEITYRVRGFMPAGCLSVAEESIEQSIEELESRHGENLLSVTVTSTAKEACSATKGPRPAFVVAPGPVTRESALAAMVFLAAGPADALGCRVAGRAGKFRIHGAEAAAYLCALTGVLSQEEAASSIGSTVGTFRSRMFRFGVTPQVTRRLGLHVAKVSGNKLSPAETAKLWALHLAGVSSTDLGARFGINPTSVQYVLHNAKGTAPVENAGSHETKTRRAVEFARTCSNEDWDAILAAVAAANGDVRQAARAMGSDEYRVAEVARSERAEVGYCGQGRVTVPARLATRIIRMRKRGMTVDAIAEQLGLTYKTVHRSLQRGGLVEHRDRTVSDEAMEQARSLEAGHQLAILAALRAQGWNQAWAVFTPYRTAATGAVLRGLLKLHGIEMRRNQGSAGSYAKGKSRYEGLDEAIEKLKAQLA
ncbi:helix-turn-helix domain-containing protein [Ramlibacter alkalitolerans]|uniref:Homeodomain-like domain-containing protein n=1 Tax=Ramlibacter alkalitolerans TaxID=2039631 RepID=A0ABS1JTW8_9BURK|nr:helix-turn-helix domain-containing protein [Ramlibacter alkalitolerans]MBL0427718.1 hypothetical protein [Ramlibacter alkalitolerans]